MRKERRIQDRLESGTEQILLEYGVPLETIPYIQIWSKEDEFGDDETILNEAIQKVEDELKLGRPGAFVTRLYDNKRGSDIVEVWSWSN